MPDPTRQTVSASQVAALFNASPYASRWMLYKQFADGVDMSSPPDGRMESGTLFEPALLELCRRERELEIVADQTYVRRGVLGCTRDAIVRMPGRGPLALETKLVNDYATWMRNWGGGKKPPVHIDLQLQAQMCVGDGVEPYSGGIIAAWVCGEMHYFDREPLPEVWGHMEGAARSFLDDVANKREPSPQGVPVELPWMTLLFPTEEETPLELAGDDGARAIALVLEFEKWREERLAAEKAYEKAKAALYAIAGTHSRLSLPFGASFAIKQSDVPAHQVKASKRRVAKAYLPDDFPYAEFERKPVDDEIDISTIGENLRAG